MRIAEASALVNVRTAEINGFAPDAIGLAVPAAVIARKLLEGTVPPESMDEWLHGAARQAAVLMGTARSSAYSEVQVIAFLFVALAQNTLLTRLALGEEPAA